MMAPPSRATLHLDPEEQQNPPDLRGSAIRGGIQTRELQVMWFLGGGMTRWGVLGESSLGSNRALLMALKRRSRCPGRTVGRSEGAAARSAKRASQSLPTSPRLIATPPTQEAVDLLIY
jgi:hypothetical protein